MVLTLVFSGQQQTEDVFRNRDSTSSSDSDLGRPPAEQTSLGEIFCAFLFNLRCRQTGFNEIFLLTVFPAKPPQKGWPHETMSNKESLSKRLDR